MKSRVCSKTSVAKILKIACLQVFLSPIRLFIREIPTYKSLTLNKKWINNIWLSHVL